LFYWAFTVIVLYYSLVNIEDVSIGPVRVECAKELV